MGYKRMDSATYLSGLLAKALSRAFSEKAAGIGFSPGQFPVLVELWAEDGLTQRALLERLDIEQATLANTLARMERDGLIERHPHPTDRRASINRLTDKGRLIEKDAIEAIEAAEASVFSKLGRFERALLLEYMRIAIGQDRHPLDLPRMEPSSGTPDSGS